MTNKIKTTYLDISDKSWDVKLLHCKHDIYHTRGWLKTSQISDSGKAFAVCIEDDEDICFVPLIKKEINEKLWDAFSPYGYGGPVFNLNFNCSKTDLFLGYLIDFLDKIGCVSCFLRLHPILNSQWQSNIGTIVAHGNTISIDLTKNANELWKEIRKSHRYEIRKAEKSGVGIKILRANEINSENISVFKKIYYETMGHVGATDYYYFNDEYFQLFFDVLQQNALLALAELNGETIAASIFTYCSSTQIMQYHLSATNSSYRDLQPSKIIISEIMNWGKNKGYLILHLGGGLGAKEDNLFKFKLGFSKDTNKFYTQRIITNKEHFKALCLKNGINFDKINLTQFFPSYRQEI